MAVCSGCGAEVPVSSLAAHAARGDRNVLRNIQNSTNQIFWDNAVLEYDERHRRELGLYDGSPNPAPWGTLMPIHWVWERGILPIYLPALKLWCVTDHENIPPSPDAEFSVTRLLAPLHVSASALTDHIKRVSEFFPSKVEVRLPWSKEEWRALQQASRSWRGQWDASGALPNWPESFNSWIGDHEAPRLLYGGAHVDTEPEPGKVAYAFLIVERKEKIISVNGR